METPRDFSELERTGAPTAKQAPCGEWIDNTRIAERSHRAFCDKCYRQALPAGVRRLGNQMVVDAGLPDTDD